MIRHIAIICIFEFQIQEYWLLIYNIKLLFLFHDTLAHSM